MRQPPCPYYGRCAGCDLQHLSYDEQLAQKQRELGHLLGYENITLHAGPELGYRNRMEFLFRTDGLGLRRRDAPNMTIRIESCLICTKRINELAADINCSFTNQDAFIPRTRNGPFRYAVIRATRSSDCISFVLNEHAPGFKDACARIKEYAKWSLAENILITYTNPSEDEQSSGTFEIVKGWPFLREQLIGKEFIFPAQGFFQNNTTMTEKMQAYVTAILTRSVTKSATLLDLYAGVGTFGISNASHFKEVIIVESDPQCIAAAEQNIQRNTVKNARTAKLEAHAIGRLKIPEGCTIITDPPRSGMSERAIEQLKHLRPEVIIYISCNPRQLGKDIRKFKSYRLASAALFDLFPQTRHSEALAELRLSRQAE